MLPCEIWRKVLLTASRIDAESGSTQGNGDGIQGGMAAEGWSTDASGLTRLLSTVHMSSYADTDRKGVVGVC